MTEKEIELLIEFHRDGERQGPGSINATLKALSFLSFEHNKSLNIADIGCGTGAQTLTLAQNLNADIIAVDLFPDFLERLESRSKELGLDHKIKTLEGNMEELPFRDEEFDLIWAEGSIYLMGFEKGIKEWKKFIKPNGFLAVSELTWTTGSRPSEIEDHWINEYPEIDTASAKIKLLEENGYSPVGYFPLPESCWLENYYEPMESKFESFLKKHNHSELAENFIEMEKAEIRKYKKYWEYFSYGFYIAKRI